MRVVHIVYGLAAWLSIGLAVVVFAGLTEGSLAWWLCLGVPGLLAAAGLFFSLLAAAMALYLALAFPSRR